MFAQISSRSHDADRYRITESHDCCNLRLFLQETLRGLITCLHRIPARNICKLRPVIMLPLIYSPLAAFISIETYLFLGHLPSYDSDASVAFFKKIPCHIVCRCRVIYRYGGYVVICKNLSAGRDYDSRDLKLFHTLIKKCKIGTQKHDSLRIHAMSEFDGILDLVTILVYVLHYDILIISSKQVLYPLYYIRKQHILVSFYDDNHRRFR